MIFGHSDGDVFRSFASARESSFSKGVLLRDWPLKVLEREKGRKWKEKNEKERENKERKKKKESAQRRKIFIL